MLLLLPESRAAPTAAADDDDDNDDDIFDCNIRRHYDRSHVPAIHYFSVALCMLWWEV